MIFYRKTRLADVTRGRRVGRNISADFEEGGRRRRDRAQHDRRTDSEAPPGGLDRFGRAVDQLWADYSDGDGNFWTDYGASNADPDQIRTAAREFAPDYFIVAGPGTTLGGAVAQGLIRANWRGLSSKADFQRMQADTPFLISMALPEQRALVTEGMPK